MNDLLRDSLRDFRQCWKHLFLTDLLFKLIAVALLTPLVAIPFRWFLSLSSDGVLADVDVLYFFLTPIGIACLITVGALSLAVIALEMTSLMGVLAAKKGRKRPVLGSIRFASLHAVPVIRVALRIIAWTLLIAAPFLIVAAIVYFSLLTEFDINYYLKARPPVFLVALAIGAVLAVGLIGLLIFFTSGWLLALPLVLFEDVSPSQALKTSRARTSGSRRPLLAAITAWVVGMFLFSSVATGIVVLIGRSLVERSNQSLALLTVAIGFSLVVGGIVNLVVNLIGTTTFASLLFHSYRLLGDPQLEKVQELADVEEEMGGFGIRLTATRIAAAIVVGLLVAALVGVWIARDIRLDNEVEVIAHRGASAAAPENTLAAVQLAIDEGTDWVEIDVQETIDGEVVVFHDSDFMKLADVNRKIWEVSLDELNDIDVGSSFSEEFADQRVPTLAQVLQLCKGKAGVNIELKYYGHNQQLEQRVIDLVESNGMEDQVIFMSLKADAVKKMKSMRPEWKTGLLMSVAFGDLGKLQADFLAVNAQFVSRQMVRKAHEVDKQVFVWTVNDPVTMAVMIGRGVDGLITDKPALARQVIAERAELNAAERLMLEFAEIFGITPQIAEQ